MEELELVFPTKEYKNQVMEYLQEHYDNREYKVRPSERRKGYSTKMIRLALQECKKLGIGRVLITCDEDNIGSRKSILNNNGIFESEIMGEQGKIIQKYWIKLNNT